MKEFSEMENLLNSKINKYINYQISQESHFNQAEIERLEKLRDLLAKRQFIDAPNRLTEYDYNKWHIRNRSQSICFIAKGKINALSTKFRADWSKMCCSQWWTCCYEKSSDANRDCC